MNRRSETRLRERGEAPSFVYGQLIALIGLGLFDIVLELFSIDGFGLMFNALGLLALIPIAIVVVIVFISAPFTSAFSARPYLFNTALLLAAVLRFLQIVDFFK